MIRLRQTFHLLYNVRKIYKVSLKFIQLFYCLHNQSFLYEHVEKNISQPLKRFLSLLVQHRIKLLVTGEKNSHFFVSFFFFARIQNEENHVEIQDSFQPVNLNGIYWMGKKCLVESKGIFLLQINATWRKCFCRMLQWAIGSFE